MIEAVLQKTIVSTFRSLYSPYKIVGSSNGINLKGLSAAKRAIIINDLKAQGFETGDADLRVILSKGVSLLIELKTENKGSKQSPDQIKFQSDVEQLGHLYFVARSSKEFFSIVNSYLTKDEKETLHSLNLPFHKDGKITEDYLFYEAGAPIALVRATLREQYNLD